MWVVMGGDEFCRYVTWTNDSGALVGHAAATTNTTSAAAAVCSVDKSAGVLCARLGLTCRCICGHSLALHAASASAAAADTAAASSSPPPSLSSAAVAASSSPTSCSAIPSSASSTAPSFSRCIQCACAGFSYMYPASALPICARNTELAAEPKSLYHSTGTRN